MKRCDFFYVFKMFAGILIVVFIFIVCIHAYCGDYKSPQINKVEVVRMLLFSDTTVFCGPDSPYYTAVRADFKDVNVSTPCFRCGKLYSDHKSSIEWSLKEATANN